MFALSQLHGFNAIEDYSSADSFLVCLYEDSGANPGDSSYDYQSTGQATWEERFKEFYDTGLFDYTDTYSPYEADSGLLSKTIALPRLQRLRLVNDKTLASTFNAATISLEFLNASDGIVFVLKSIPAGGWDTNLQYGNNLSSGLSTATQFGSGKQDGFIDFESGQMRHTNNGGRNDSFTYSCDALSVTQMRLSNTQAYCNVGAGTGRTVIYVKYEYL